VRKVCAGAGAPGRARLAREGYGRYGNPTWCAVERKLCDLEGGEAAVLFAWGMCAATTLFLALLPRGGHLVVTSDCYRRTRQFIRVYLVTLAVATTVIEPADTKALAAAICDDTALFFTESPTNPYLRVVDIEETVRVCHARGVKVVIDSTFASPVSQRALDGCADYVLHSAAKFLGGHNDLLAGCAIGSAEAIGPVREAVVLLGGVLDPHAAYLLLRGLKTLSLRVERHNDNALRVARWLEEQDAVRRVWYPGLESHPDHATASQADAGLRRRRDLRARDGPRGRHALRRCVPDSLHRAEPGRGGVADRDARPDARSGTCRAWRA